MIRPLLSRCQVYVLKSLESRIWRCCCNGLTEDLILKDRKITVKESDALFRFSGGDARKLLNILDLTISSDDDADHSGEEVVITDKLVTERLQENPAAYDKGGEMLRHYLCLYQIGTGQ